VCPDDARKDPMRCSSHSQHPMAEMATALGITIYLARRKWTDARAWFLGTPSATNHAS